MDEEQLLKNRGLSVRDAWNCYSRCEGLKNFPGLLMRILREEAWRDRIVTQTHKRQQFNTFKDFLSTEGPEGLGIPMSTIDKICREYGCLDVLLAIEEVDARGPGGDRRSDDFKTADGAFERCTLSDKSSGKLLARLKREQPELLDSVLAGDMTIHAASVEAGFRKKEYRMPHDPEAAGAYLAKRVSREWFEIMRIAFEEASQP